MAPYIYCEHPAASPAYGANWVNTALQSVFANPEIWEHTVFLVMYDENDGFFDHVIPPTPPAGTPEEFVDGQAIGLGNRVPLWVISPWSRGGWVNSQVFDQTSVLRFLEVVTGVGEPNVSAWRRAVCGDLTTCFDFSAPDFSVPALPDTTAPVEVADASVDLASAGPPAAGAQSMPAQEQSRGRRHRALPYRASADIKVDDARMVCELSNQGSVAFPFTVIPNFAFPFRGTPYTVEPGHSAQHEWDMTATAGWYDLAVHGPDGFSSRFLGSSSSPCSVGTRLTEDGSSLIVSVTNRSEAEQKFAVAESDAEESSRIGSVDPGATVNVIRPIGRIYDVTVKVDSDPFFLHRYAATVHPLVREAASSPEK